MNNLSNATLTAHQKQRHCWSVYSCKPIPRVALLVLVPLFLIGLGVSIFILVVVHNALFFIFLLFLSALVAAFLLWNSRNAALLFYLRSFPDSDLRFSCDGDIVKITGVSLSSFLGFLITTYFPVFVCFSIIENPL